MAWLRLYLKPRGCNIMGESLPFLCYSHTSRKFCDMSHIWPLPERIKIKETTTLVEKLHIWVESSQRQSDSPQKMYLVILKSNVSD